MEETSQEAKNWQSSPPLMRKPSKFGFHSMLLSPSKVAKYISGGENWNVSVHAMPIICGGWWGICNFMENGEETYNSSNWG